MRLSQLVAQKLPVCSALLDVLLSARAVFASATETFSKRNVNCTIEESIQRMLSVVEKAKQNNIRLRGSVFVL